ncbi:hypothetical protein JQS43_15410 [Natronosporangium hydrolyticum]|uniref:Uncharacterized protein n=1 Tax=Natronosporangium hydrolyticum TaxID=2811111 RepID=A0A895YES6_9ACTN|nr:hypothetical protein [Natronosporangium hydrolyticum]QSB13036.1 hypothetical protein JQS43_15410 [Natronosporangium hydrolyticum]
MGSAGILIPLLVIFMVFGGMGAIIKLVEGRRQHQLELKREETRQAEAKAKEREIEQRRAELEYREALLELERFDRRSGQPPRPVPPELYPPGTAAPDRPRPELPDDPAAEGPAPA